MENVLFTQLTLAELKEVFRLELESFFTQRLLKQSEAETDQFLTIKETSDFLSLAVPTIYNLVSRSAIPSMKKGKRLYFSKFELMEWLKTGKKKTKGQLEQEADKFLLGRKKN